MWDISHSWCMKQSRLVKPLLSVMGWEKTPQIKLTVWRCVICCTSKLMTPVLLTTQTDMLSFCAHGVTDGSLRAPECTFALDQFLNVFLHPSFAPTLPPFTRMATQQKHFTSKWMCTYLSTGAIHHTRACFSHPVLRARHAVHEADVLCDTSTWASGETWAPQQPCRVGGGKEGRLGEEGGLEGVTAEPGELRIAEHWGKPRWSHYSDSHSCQGCRDVESL